MVRAWAHSRRRIRAGHASQAARAVRPAVDHGRTVAITERGQRKAEDLLRELYDAYLKG